MKTDNYTIIKDKVLIRQLMRKNKLKFTDLAKKMKYSQPHISNAIRQEKKVPWQFLVVLDYGLREILPKEDYEQLSILE